MQPIVWIDFENAPHVWVLSPIIKNLRSRGYRIWLTARDFSYTLSICRHLGLDVDVVGESGSGKNTVEKIARFVERAFLLARLVRSDKKNIGLALSHGSRSQIMAAHLSGIPAISMDDYEYSDQSLVRFVEHLLVPFPIPKEHWGHQANKIVQYPGMKEELYLHNFRPGPNLPELSHSWIKILFRPEGPFTHYHSDRSEALQYEVLNYLSKRTGILLVLLPRNPEQGAMLADFCSGRKIQYWVPQCVLDGPALVWQMDAVIGGGGTMTREAAALGVPAYSFFAGQWGAVDNYLESAGRLIHLLSPEDVNKIVVRKRAVAPILHSPKTLDFITNFVDGFVSVRNAKARAEPMS